MKGATLTVPLAAALRGVNQSTIRRWIAAGRLEAVKTEGHRGGAAGTVYQIPASAFRLHVDQGTSRSATVDQQPGQVIDFGTFASRGGVAAARAAEDRRRIMDAALQLTGPNRTEQMRQLAQTAGVSVSTLYRWISPSRTDGVVTREGAAKTMRSKFDEKGRRRRRSIEPEARDFFLAVWNQQNNLTVPAVIELYYKPYAAEKGWSVPSRATFYRLVGQDLSAAERMAGRKGVQALRGTAMPKNTLLPPDQSNYVWESDHRPHDFLVLDEETGELRRPYLTIWVERSARAWLGDAYDWNPSSDTIQRAFQKAVYATAPFSPGVPVHAVTDNGQDYKSKVVTGMLKDLGIQHHLCEAYSGWQKGTVESLLKFVSLWFDRSMPNWTGHNVLARPELCTDEDLRKMGRIITLKQYETGLANCRHYYNMQHKHSGEGMDGKTPAERYAELSPARIGVPAAGSLKLLMMKEDRRKVSSQGIKMFARLMWHDDLFNNKNRVNRTMAEEWVTVRWDPADESQVLVFYEGEYVCTAVDKAKPTFAPDDAQNMAVAGRIWRLAKEMTKTTMERVHETAAALPWSPWISPIPGTKSPEASPATAEAPRMITKADRTVKAMEEQKAREQAKRRRNESVSEALRAPVDRLG